jgi:hypothetical protein
LTYLYNAAIEKSTWVVSDPSDDKKSRTFDGQSCAVIVR